MKRLNRTISIYAGFISELKTFLVSKLHWGRGSFYKNSVHLSMIAITVIVAVSGISSRIATADASGLTGNDVFGSADLLSQGASVQSVLPYTQTGISYLEHSVISTETLQIIADKYKVTKDTIRWFNPNLISPFSDEIQIGLTLKIPAPEGIPINGVLYQVKEGQTLDDVIALTSRTNSESNRFNIVQFNNLAEPYTLKTGQQLFIPDGNLNVSEIVVAGIPTGVFSNPLADPSCSGYRLSRGFAYYHNGLDLARWPGCTIQAVASGIIEYAGCTLSAEGCHIIINHGGGIATHYYHGNGTFYVKSGDRVEQGQSIMEMGTTGNSTGVHLHFSLLKDRKFIDPKPYVPY